MKKLFFTILLLILFLGLLPIAKADQQLLIEYPEISGMKLGTETTLPKIIKYIYLFSLGIVGLTAFVSIIIGAVQYITSAGNDSKMGDAKDRITSALLGILILLASVLILRTINPDLINLEFSLNSTQGKSACYCYDWGEEDSFQSCYANKDQCASPCDSLCKGKGYANGDCRTGDSKCP
jgi:hypothetical protein